MPLSGLSNIKTILWYKNRRPLPWKYIFSFQLAWNIFLMLMTAHDHLYSFKNWIILINVCLLILIKLCFDKQKPIIFDEMFGMHANSLSIEHIIPEHIISNLVLSSNNISNSLILKWYDLTRNQTSFSNVESCDSTLDW